MRTRVIARRTLKALLYCAVFIVLLSIGLRIYSAWQIPKAKRLLSELSQIRIGQPADDSVRGMLRKHNFEPDNSCADSDCYETEISGAAPVAYDATWSNRMQWLLHHGILRIGTSALVADGVAFGCPQNGIHYRVLAHCTHHGRVKLRSVFSGSAYAHDMGTFELRSINRGFLGLQRESRSNMEIVISALR